MAKLEILVPKATTNYIANPAMRYDTTGWNASGSIISRSLDRARFGVASLKVVANGSVLNEGAYYRVNSLQTSRSVTVSVYARGDAVVRIRLLDNPNGKQWMSKATVITDDRWTRLDVTGYGTGSNDLRLYVELAYKNTKVATFYVDGAQMENYPYPTSYCDGDQSGCQWNGVYHNSASFRNGDTRAGGRWINLNDDPDLYYTTIGGLGVAPIRNNTQPYADAPGSFFQNFKVIDRVITVLFHAKNKSRFLRAANLAKLHSLRQSLFSLIQPDKTAGGEEFWMRYTNDTFPMYFRARYDTGLEGEWDARNQWTQSFPVRFLALSPFITDDDYQVSSLSIRERTTVNYVLRRVNGEWLTMNGGMNNQIYDFAVGSRGQVYAVGAFTRSNNMTTAIDPQIYSNYAAYWDGTQWQRLGSGANGAIHSVAVAPNGYIYVIGEFTSIGGVAANRIAYWDGAAWNAMGIGLNGIGYAIAVSSDGSVYAGGAFTTAGGNSAYYFAIWNGSSWRSGGVEGGLNNTVYALAVTQDGVQIYVGGEFTDEFGSPGNLALQYVGMYDSSTNQFYDTGDGFDAAVRKLRIGKSGRVYAGGDFTESGGVSPDTLLYVAYYNGTAWFNLGVGANGIVRNLAVNENEHVLAVGDFTRMGSVDANYGAFWNGATWSALDVNLGASSRAVAFDRYDNIYLSQNAILADYAKLTTVTNVGTSESNPMLYMKGPLTLRWLENQTAKKRVFCDMTLQPNEEATLDFGTGTVLSTIQGDLSWAIQAGSDLRAWTLLPGNNVISVFVSSDIGALMYLGYTPRYWSADSTVKMEGFE